MMMMVASAAATDCLREILQIGELAALRGAGEVRRELGELAGRAGVALRCGRLGSGLQVGGDLRRYLLVFGWVRFLKLLQGADQLRKW